MLNKLWVEKHRPKTIEQVIFGSEDEKQYFTSLVRDQTLPNLLLTGSPGVGKSTISLALMNDLQVDPADVLKINCSDEKIEALRDKVKVFAFTMPMGSFKVVRLEEIDHLSNDGQALLRDLIESTSSSCRFVATANYKNRIIPALQSRFHHVEFSKPLREDVLIRMAEILAEEGVEFELDDLERVLTASYPDLRRTFSLLEAGSRTGKLKIQGNQSIQDWKLQLLPLLEADDLGGARKLVCESATKEELQDVYRFLFDNLDRVKRLKGKQDQAVVLLAQYQYQHAFVADPEIQIAALFIELGAL
jgi:DNA polymerase III delta prime subunit